MNSGVRSQHGTSATETTRSFLALLREKNSEAWDRLVMLYSPLICQWCRRMHLPEQDMPDVFQEVFRSVARNIAGFRHGRPGETFRGWLRTITRNKIRDHYRRLADEPKATGGTGAQRWLSQQPAPEFGEGSMDLVSDGAEQELCQELFRRALTLVRPHFHEQTWQAFWRVVVEGRTAQEVAEELALRPGTVRVAKSRVLHRLRRELGDVLE